MTAPDPVTTAALDACYASAADTIPEIVETALAYARPVIEAQAAVALDVLKAAQWFAETWRELLAELPGNYSCSMTCTEAEAVAGLYRALGRDDDAAQILRYHAECDEPGDVHYEEAETGG